MKNGEKYKPYIIKEYEFWTLFLHSERPLPYVGRTIAWWKDRRPGEGKGLTLLDIAGAPTNELFRKVYMGVWRGYKALGYEVNKIGTEFLINTSYLANEESHGHNMHWHFVPRWRQPFHMNVLDGKIAVDEEWGAHYHGVYAKHPDRSFALSEDALQRIRHIMASAIH